MKIIEISLKLGATVNLGDYNNFRPEIGGKAVVEPFDDPDRVFVELEEQLVEHLARMVDDELEQAGREPRYARDLYVAKYSDVRQCVVVARERIELPAESNWRDTDRWYRADHGLPSSMRYATAKKAAVAAADKKAYLLYFVHTPDELADLPPLSDPGPEPLWSQKGLKEWFTRIQVPDTEWDMLAALPHVTPEHIQMVYRNSPYSNYARLRDGILDATTLAAADEEE